MKKLIFVLLLLSMMILAFSSCSCFFNEAPLEEVTVGHVFENETWLVIDGYLINKQDGKACRLQLDPDKAIPGAAEVNYLEAPTWQCVFNESSFEQHTFLEVYLHSNTPSYVPSYYECVLTYGYDGKEIDRAYTAEPLTRDQMYEVYAANLSSTSIPETFTFSVTRGFGYIGNKAYDIAENQAILEFVKNRYDTTDETSLPAVEGLAKQMGEEIWFSATVSNRWGSIRPEPLRNGIYRSEIIAYDPKTSEFRTIYEYGKKRKQIIDFDENGIYILDFSGALCYVDFESEKSTLIHQFSGAIDHFIITDQYIYAEYVSNGLTCLVYQKGGTVIANGSY